MGLSNHKRKMSISLSITLIFPLTVANLAQTRGGGRKSTTAYDICPVTLPYLRPVLRGISKSKILHNGQRSALCFFLCWLQKDFACAHIPATLTFISAPVMPLFHGAVSPLVLKTPKRLQTLRDFSGNIQKPTITHAYGVKSLGIIFTPRFFVMKHLRS